MKTFVVEGHNWRQQIEIDDSLYEKNSDMATEAMTQAVERINNGEAENLIEENAHQMFGVALIMTAWPRGQRDQKVMALTEHIFRNAGRPAEAECMRKASEARENK